MLSGKEFFSKVVFPILGICLLLLIFIPICTKETGIDYFMLWICVGCPFGIGKMFGWLIPRNFDLGTSVAIIVLNFVIGGLIGGVVAVFRVITAVYYLLVTICSVVFRQRA